MCTKLEHIGVRGFALKLFESYLSNREQFTIVDGRKSMLETITCGVPQGSVLGPLLFLLYVNDLPNCSNFQSWLFADDAVLVMSDKSLEKLEQKMNIEASKLHDWLLANKLTIHYTDKTTYMLIKYKKNQKLQDFKFHIGTNQIKQCSEYKYLGVIIDNKLNWKSQIEALSKKIAGVVMECYTKHDETLIEER